MVSVLNPCTSDSHLEKSEHGRKKVRDGKGSSYTLQEAVVWRLLTMRGVSGSLFPTSTSGLHLLIFFFLNGNVPFNNAENKKERCFTLPYVKHLPRF